MLLVHVLCQEKCHMLVVTHPQRGAEVKAPEAEACDSGSSDNHGHVWSTTGRAAAGGIPDGPDAHRPYRLGLRRCRHRVRLPTDKTASNAWLRSPCSSAARGGLGSPTWQRGSGQCPWPSKCFILGHWHILPRKELKCKKWNIQNLQNGSQKMLVQESKI